MSSPAHEDAASRWLVKQESGNWSDEDQSTFDSWLTASTANRIAYLRVKNTWQGAARLRALQGKPASEGVPSRGSWQIEQAPHAPTQVAQDERPAPPVQPVRGRKSRLFEVLAAACVIGLIGAYALMNGVFSGRGYSTPIGATETIALHDGSTVTLNTNSDIRVDLGPGERHIALRIGEIYVQVAKDANRPFVVQAGDHRVVAVGTAFSVRRRQEDIVVIVTEGTVRLEPQGRQSGAGTGTNPQLVEAGEVASIVNGRATIRAQQEREAERILSWRSGYVAFENATLAEAVAEFNRYTTQPIVIQDSSIADIRLSGNFRIDNVEGFLALLQDGFNIAIQHNAKDIALQAR